MDPDTFIRNTAPCDVLSWAFYISDIALQIFADPVAQLQQLQLYFQAMNFVQLL
jgi:hypothetical protein